jgi:hypothetical protein
MFVETSRRRVLYRTLQALGYIFGQESAMHTTTYDLHTAYTSMCFLLVVALQTLENLKKNPSRANHLSVLGRRGTSLLHRP